MVRVVRNPFYLSDEQASSTPSRHDQITEEQEFLQRVYGCELIQECGILLRLSQVVMATGQVFFHRFYHRCSLGKFNHIWMAAAALFLACKVEEQLRRLREVVTVVYYCFTKRESKLGKLLDAYGAQGYEWKMEVVKAERFLLKELGFHTGVEHPHKFILVYLNTLRSHSGIDTQDENWKSLLQRSWNYANDMLRTDLCCRVPPEYIACGCIYLAANDCDIVLSEGRIKWWQVFGVEEDGIHLVADTAGRLYQLEKVAGRYEDLTSRERIRMDERRQEETFGNDRKSASRRDEEKGQERTHEEHRRYERHGHRRNETRSSDYHRHVPR
eukprot:jgi/Galph1/230/GphlegSOOS_G4898.1